MTHRHSSYHRETLALVRQIHALIYELGDMIIPAQRKRHKQDIYTLKTILRSRQ